VKELKLGRHVLCQQILRMVPHQGEADTSKSLKSLGFLLDEHNIEALHCPPPYIIHSLLECNTTDREEWTSDEECSAEGSQQSLLPL
jgi:hypothetical protein